MTPAEEADLPLPRVPDCISTEKSARLPKIAGTTLIVAHCRPRAQSARTMIWARALCPIRKGKRSPLVILTQPSNVSGVIWWKAEDLTMTQRGARRPTLDKSEYFEMAPRLMGTGLQLRPLILLA